MSGNTKKTAIIIGAGPAGLTAAYELLKRTDIKPILIEADEHYVGGIARTVNYKGNRIDIGGHRFFSKSDRVMDWWLDIMPVEKGQDDLTITYHNKTKELHDLPHGTDPEKVMLVRNRKSRIYYNKTFFDYPVKLNADTLKKLGFIKVIKIGFSYVWSTLFPIRNEQNLEQFFINRFGKELYLTFFKEYTEKVWGRPCSEISAEWGKQRIKGLSLRSALANFVISLIGKDDDLKQKNKETSLIERFLYPKYGPGQLWEIVRDNVLAQGAELHMGYRCTGIESSEQNQVTTLRAVNASGEELKLKGDYFISTMPIKDLIKAWKPEAPSKVKKVAEGLEYRDFFTVGLLVKNLKINAGHSQAPKLIKDNWIYVQEPGVEIGRLQIFNNWSPYLVKDPDTVWLGLEYFCKETDEIWNKPDEELIQLGKRELEDIGILEETPFIDACVIRMPKTYPAYFGTYGSFDEVRNYLDQFENFFPIGRNGMHKYNNQDHSMLTAMTAVDNMLSGRTDKSNLWEINTEEDYHEEK